MTNAIAPDLEDSGDIQSEQADAIEAAELVDEIPTSKAEKVAAAVESSMRTVIDKGLGPLSGSVDWAESRLAKVQKDRYRINIGSTRTPGAEESADIEKVINRLIIESVEAAAVNGFVTGLGGLVLMPIAIPANIAGALVINARLAAAIAYLRGYDIKDPHVATVVTLVALGSNAQQILKTVGVKVGQQFAMGAIKKVPTAVLKEINKKVGFSLVAKYGTKRAPIVLVKGVPFVGGIVGGAVDATMTGLVGRTAKTMFSEI
jgi:hypothetical protein